MTPQPPVPQIPGYEILNYAGSGSSGHVWRCRQISTGKLLAAKVVPLTVSAGRAEMERQALDDYRKAADGNPHLIQIREVIETDHQLVIVMELADAIGKDPYRPKTLASMLADKGKLTTREALTIAKGCLVGLESLHANKLIHRDVKPSNILFVGGQSKIADPGLVSPMGFGRHGQGTIGFVPTKCELPDASHDLFAIGRLLYVMLTGCAPYKYPFLPVIEQTSAQVPMQIAANHIMNSAADEKTIRFSSAAQFIREIDDALEGRPRSWKRRWPETVAFTATVALMIWLFRPWLATILPSVFELPPKLVGARITHDPQRPDSKGLELDFDQRPTVRCPVSQGLHYILRVDIRGDGFGVIAAGGNEMASKEFQGQLCIIEPLDCLSGQTPKPRKLIPVGNEPPATFGEQANPRSVVPLWAGDLDGLPGDEVIVAVKHLRGPCELIVLGAGWKRLAGF